MSAIGLAVRGPDAAAQMIEGYGREIRKGLPNRNVQAATLFEKTWKSYLAGPSTRTRIGRKTGFLGRSIFTRREGADAVTGTAARHARIHEVGGKTKPRVIRPRTRKTLRFVIGGKVVFARRVNHPGSKIPARPHMGPSLKLAMPAIEKVYDGLTEEAAKIANANVRSLRRNQLKLARAA